MKIQYDHQIFTMQKFGGISRYYYELIKNSDNLYEPELSGIFSNNVYIETLGMYKSFPIKRYFRGRDRVIAFLNKRDSLQKLKNNKEIFHPTYYSDYYFGKTIHCKTVLTVYDMIHEKFPDYFSPNDGTSVLKRRAIEGADIIIAISESTKKDILEIYPDIPSEKIKVVYLGNSLEELHITKRAKDYILFTGQRKGYKNFETFIRAVAPLLIKYNLRLKCTGQSFTEQEKELFSELGISELIDRVFAKDEELSYLYANALVFVFPSLYEGFGIPVLEAFSSGCPLLASNTSSLPEIGGNASLYFNPYSTNDIREKIETVILSESLQNQLIGNGYERLKSFSWKKCAQETAEIYQEVLGK